MVNRELKLSGEIVTLTALAADWFLFFTFSWSEKGNLGFSSNGTARRDL
jgi:hypothetical protein